MRHIERDHEGKRFSCNHCDFSGRSKGHLDKHFEQSHVSPTLFCDLCGFGCSSKTGLAFHRNRRHPVLTCHHCDFTCREQVAMSTHQETHEQIREHSARGSVRAGAAEEEVPCPFRACPHVFSSVRELERHQKRHLFKGALHVGSLPKADNECRFCGQIVSSGPNALRHENRRCPLNPDLTSDEEKQLLGNLEETPKGRCVRCGKVFVNEVSQLRHEQICEDVSICSLCKRRYATYAQMRRHKNNFCPKRQSHHREDN